MFRSLSGFNYRLWFLGLLVSNTGTWMQRTAQDWIVLTELTDHNALAVGVTMALQFAPQLLLVPWSGLIADRLERRKLLLVTQIAAASTSLVLGILVVTHTAQLWHVFLLAFLFGIATAVDAPARQTFVSELVPEKDLPNAVALNSASFNGARLIGPAVAGLLIGVVGGGWVFVINAITYGATVAALLSFRKSELRHAPRVQKAKGQIRAGLAYVRSRSDIVVMLICVFLIGTFGMNFPIFIATMATVEFGKGSAEYGILSSVLAIGSIVAALLAARRERPRLRVILLALAGFGIGCAVAAVAPTYLFFAVVLVFIGFCSLSMMTSANAYVQTTTAPMMRGRVMALYMAIFTGGTPIGAPLVGLVADAFGPRWALSVGAVAGVLAAAVFVVWLVKYRGMRVSWNLHERPHVHVPVLAADRRAALTGELAVVEAADRAGA